MVTMATFGTTKAGFLADLLIRHYKYWMNGELKTAVAGLIDSKLAFDKKKAKKEAEKNSLPVKNVQRSKQVGSCISIYEASEVEDKHFVKIKASWYDAVA